MNLEEKIISEISGNFIIEAYQRGYRWGKRRDRGQSCPGEGTEDRKRSLWGNKF